MTQSADGSDPIFLLNAQRVSGYEEIGNLPPEAIEKVEGLPEPAALRYGYPPTRRVLNFITKRRFRQVAIKPDAGVATRGGLGNGGVHADVTRLRGDGRVTLSLDARHTDRLLQSQRRVLPDPDVPFDALGNVTAPGLVVLNGGGVAEIDPALSGLAGQVVTIAPVPAGTGEAVPTLAGFAAGANRPRLFDLSPLHSLAPAHDQMHGEAVVANRIGDGLSGSLTLTADRSRDATLLGPASATLIVPAGNPFSPFTRDVALQRYLVEADPLRQRITTTTLHAGAVVRGTWHGWQWDGTATLDHRRAAGFTQTAIDTGAAQAALAAGADPFRPLASALVATPLTDRTVQVTQGAGAKLVATGYPLRLPAGLTTVTASLEGERTGSDGRTTGGDTYAAQFGRTRVEGQVAIDVPIASRREQVGRIGDLSANASVAVRGVGGFGTLADATGGLTWAPVPAIQLLGQVKASAAAPTLDQLAAPPTSAPQVPVFDFATGRSTLVTLLVGGNPALAAEHRLVRSLGITAKPFAKRELRLGATFEATRIADGVQTIYALTPATVAALPDLFTRDAAGTLTDVSYRPTNVYREWRRALNLTVSANGFVGRARPPTAPGGQPPERTSFYAGIGPTITFTDQVMLRPGSATLDLLRGDTLSGGITPRVAGYGYGGINKAGNGATMDFYCFAGERIRGAVAASTLDFSGLCKVNASGSLSLHHFLSHQAWTRHLGLKLEVANITDAHQRVRDGNGRTPWRYQADLLDPIGRTISLSLRKLF